MKLFEYRELQSKICWQKEIWILVKFGLTRIGGVRRYDLIQVLQLLQHAKTPRIANGRVVGRKKTFARQTRFVSVLFALVPPFADKNLPAVSSAAIPDCIKDAPRKSASLRDRRGRHLVTLLLFSRWTEASLPVSNAETFWYSSVE